MELPILFQSPLVAAIIAGNKTETRRLRGLDEINYSPDDWEFCFSGLTPDRKKFKVIFRNKKTEKFASIICPFGQPFDVLWVRETWCQPFRPMSESATGSAAGYMYKADDDGIQINPGSLDGKWKPSIHMPRKACRLFLENEIIYLERVQQISHDAARAEGIKREWDGTHYWYENYDENDVMAECMYKNPIDSFKSLWNKINGPKGMGWDKNPWVWVIRFKQLTNYGN